MPGPALTLGPLVFRGFEIPSSIMFGGRQRTAVRFLASGEKTVDILGPDDSVVTFAGSLTGPNATTRAREIDAMRTTGQILTLSWNDFNYTVIIQNFDASYKNRWWIDYKIRCLAVRNLNYVDAVSGLSAVDEALSSLNAMYDTVPASLLPIDDARPALAVASQAQSVAVATELQASIGTLAAQQQQLEPALGRISLDAAITPQQFLADFGPVADAAGTLQYLALAQAYLGQSSTNLLQDALS